MTKLGLDFWGKIFVVVLIMLIRLPWYLLLHLLKQG